MRIGPGPARAAYLADACSDDAGLRRQETEDVVERRGELDRIIKDRNLPESLARFLEARHETRMRALPDPPSEVGQPTPATRGAQA